ncbi:MAG: glycosyltransferase family 1 protein [bacterium]|nr:glycosyltransferase family 1 protein [bacterium]
MTIAINATSARMGGALTYITNLIASIFENPRGMTFLFFISDALLIPDSPHPTVRLIRIPATICNSSWRILWWQNVTLPALLKVQSIDLLYSTANFATFFCPCPQILLIRIPLYFSREYIQHILPKKNTVEKIDFYLRRLLIVFSAQQATTLLFPSKSMQNDFLAFMPKATSKSKTNLYGTHIKKWRIDKQEKTTGEPINILCTSHYSDYKNYTTLLQALQILALNKLHFTFTAPINLDLPLFQTAFTFHNDKELLASNELKDKVRLLGPVSLNELAALYQNADIFAWPSLAESFGHPLIEAMAAEIPIICSDIPVNRELCGAAALYFNPHDPHALAQLIENLIVNSDTRKQLAINGTSRVESFEWEGHVERLCDLFTASATQI